MRGGQNSTGANNTFIGNYAGWQNTTGANNIFLGYLAGQSNTFLGYNAGSSNSTGSGNIFIGHNAASVPIYRTADNKLVVGNGSHMEWITGDIGTSNLRVNGVAVVTSSSRVLKKNIQPYKSFDKALEEILKTPLFTYEYKKDHPEKSRMGIIAEELPKHLRFKDNSNLPHPDWPSIYGTFWASIKALSSHFENLKQQLNKLAKAFSEFKRQTVDQITGISSRLLATEKKQKAILKTSQSLTKTNQNLKKAKELLSQELTQTKFRLNETNKQLEQRYNSLSVENKNLSRELSQAKFRLNENSKQLVRTQKILKQNQKTWTVKNKQLSKELAEIKAQLKQNNKNRRSREIQALKKQMQSLIRNSK